VAARRRAYEPTCRLTQRELAALAGVSRNLVAKYERAQTLVPSVEAVVRLGLALRVEALLDPRTREALSHDVESRRPVIEARARRRIARTRRRRARQ